MKDSGIIYNCDVCGQYIQGSQVFKHKDKILCKAHYRLEIAKAKNKNTPEKYKKFKKLMESVED